MKTLLIIGLLSGLMLAQAQSQRPNGGTTGPESALHSTTVLDGESAKLAALLERGLPVPVVKPEDRLRVKDAQIAQDQAANEEAQAFITLLQSPQIAALHAATARAETAKQAKLGVIADVEKHSGCKLDPATVECVPPVKPEPAVKPEAKK